MSAFLTELNAVYARMLTAYVGGLSNTSTSKFDGIRRLFARLIERSEADVYAVGAGTRPGNIEVRLSQGTRAFQHTPLGIAFVKADSAKQVGQLASSAVTTIKGFLDRGKAVYDSILVLVEVNGLIHPARLVTYPDSPVKDAVIRAFSGVPGFTVDLLSARVTTPAAKAVETLTATVSVEREAWIVPDDPNAGAFDFPLQRLLEGSAGSGKSFRLSSDVVGADRVIRTVFHPEMGFADFVGYLAPETAYRIEDPAPIFNKALPGEPSVYYTFQVGPLLEAYVLAVLNPQHRVVLLIEEMSRAPASLVFGEILQLLDRVRPDEQEVGLAPSGFSRYEIRPRNDVKAFLESIEASSPHTQLGGMRFPPNLYLWATMNRADQNARQLDTAFLRRWTREHLSYEMAGHNDGVGVVGSPGLPTWGDLRARLNDVLLTAGVREDKLIGAYFVGRDALSVPGRMADDVLAYVWYDVLRERGGTVFPGVRTFSELRAAWLDGTLVIGE